MNRQQQFKKLCEDWLELDLESTCTAMDLHSSIRIEHKGKTLKFYNKRAGVVAELGQASLDDNNKVIGMVYVTSTPALGIMLYGLEKAIAQN